MKNIFVDTQLYEENKEGSDLENATHIRLAIEYIDKHGWQFSINTHAAIWNADNHFYCKRNKCLKNGMERLSETMGDFV